MHFKPKTDVDYFVDTLNQLYNKFQLAYESSLETKNGSKVSSDFCEYCEKEDGIGRIYYVDVVSTHHYICSDSTKARWYTMAELILFKPPCSSTTTVIDPYIKEMRQCANLLPETAQLLLFHKPKEYDVYRINWKV